jgi:hypothetical protein
MTVYSIYSQFPSTAGGHLLNPQPYFYCHLDKYEGVYEKDFLTQNPLQMPNA